MHCQCLPGKLQKCSNVYLFGLEIAEKALFDFFVVSNQTQLRELFQFFQKLKVPNVTHFFNILSRFLVIAYFKLNDTFLITLLFRALKYQFRKLQVEAFICCRCFYSVLKKKIDFPYFDTRFVTKYSANQGHIISAA